MILPYTNPFLKLKMRTSNSRLVQMWMESAGQLVTAKQDTDAFVELQDNQMTYVEEEFYELLHAYNNLDREDVIKEACDLIWVAYGLLHTMGVDTDTAFGKVSDSNMSKLPFTYKNGKVQKGPNYRKPNLKEL
tara:strand:+ start:898 stop:1296 length:399 start_codon:yes stop_codon:yes gene_type:complete